MMQDRKQRKGQVQIKHSKFSKENAMKKAIRGMELIAMVNDFYVILDQMICKISAKF